MKSVHIYGSTGIIGEKTIDILSKYFPKYKVDILLANQNYKKLAKQSIKLRPKYICLLDKSKYLLLKKEITNNKIIINNTSEINEIIRNTKSDVSILAISGYSALKFLNSIIYSTKNLGLVNKESIVSAGHLLNKLCKKNDTNLIALDSEHYSIQNFFNQINLKNFNDIRHVYLTASGGPFLHKKNFNINKINFKDAIKHPKWKMGIKNSLDSATLVNKCLEIIEAHYLFNLDFNKLKILIHPEALVHSIIEFNNNTSNLNYFYHDMLIPIFNFLNSINNNKEIILNRRYDFKSKSMLNFSEPKEKLFPILKIFNKMDKYDPKNLIKFNTANEIAVNLFSKNMIKFSDINRIINKSLNIDIKFNTNSIDNIITYQEILINKLKFKLKLNTK